MAGYLVVRWAADRSDARGELSLPTDVRLAPWLIAALCLVGPVLSLAIAAVLLRRVVIGPFGLVRRGRANAPDWWPLILVAGPLAILPLLGPQAWLWSHSQIPVELGAATMFGVVAGGLVCACVGVGLGGGWTAHAFGRLLGTVARRPSTLIAARRLMDDPWSGSRTYGTLLVSVFLGACIAGLRVFISAGVGARQEGMRRDPTAPPYRGDNYFAVLTVMDLAVVVAILIAVAALLVALVERSLAHRRSYASLVAAGLPRSVLARAAMWQVVVPVGPALLLAVAAGGVFVRLMIGSQAIAKLPQPVCPSTAPCDLPVLPAEMTLHYPLPWGHLALLGGATFTAVLVVVGLSLLFARSSTDLVELRTA